MANLVDGVISGALTRSEFGESDIDNYFENNIENVYARVVNLRINTQNIDGSSLIWNNTTYGIWGSYYWSGSLSTPIVRSKEQFMWIDYIDSFDNQNYMPKKDSIVFFKFENNLSNDGSSNITATAFNTPTYGIGKNGSSIIFSHTGSQYVKFIDTVRPSNSVSLWFKPNIVSGSRQFVWNNFNNTIDGFGLEITTSGSLTLYNDLNDIDQSRYGSPISADSWYHAVNVFANGSDYFYINGVLKGSGASTGSLTELLGSYYIGQRGNNTSFFSGSVDSFRLYDFALTPAEVKYLYNSGFGITDYLSNLEVNTVSGWGTGSVVFRSDIFINSISFINGSSNGISISSGSITLS